MAEGSHVDFRHLNDLHQTQVDNYLAYFRAKRHQVRALGTL
jgi:hypothetical protein